MRPIRVLHITPSVRLLGARRSLLTLVKELSGGRIEPIVLAPAAGALTEELEKRRLGWIQLRLPPWRKASSWGSMAFRVKRLREICDEQKIDLIHCNEIYPNPHALVASACGGVALESVNRLIQGRGLSPVQRPIVTHMRLSVTPRMIRNYYLGDATRIIAVSNAAASDFDSFRWKEEKVRVVYNGIDAGEFEEARSRRDHVRNSLGYTPDDFVIGQIGLLMPRKRPKFLLESAPAILREVPNAKFLFVGEASPTNPAYYEELRALSIQLGLEGAVTFLPFQPQVAEFFGALDLHVLLSGDEGFGRVILEAGAAHVPTIGSNVGGIPELIEDGQTGFLIGDRNATDEQFGLEVPHFVELVVELARDGGLRRRLGDNASEMTRAHFSTEQYVQGVSNVFDEAMNVFDSTKAPW